MTGKSRATAHQVKRQKEAAEKAHEGNRAVVARIRDVAKWLLLVFGAIGGVLITGIQLSDLGKAKGEDTALAIAGITLGVLGAAVALGFTVNVLLPVRMTLPALATKARWPWAVVRILIRAEPELLYERGESVGDLLEAKKQAEAKKKAAKSAFGENETDTRLRDDLEQAEADYELLHHQIQELLAFTLTETVKWRMIRTSVAVFIGAGVVVLGMVLFALATNRGNRPPEEAVPMRLSAVVLRLTQQGRDDLHESLGPGCDMGRLRAIALGGPPSRMHMSTVPGPNCRAAHFILTPSFGSVVKGKTLPTLRACAVPDPRMPCVVYPNSAALVTGQP